MTPHENGSSHCTWPGCRCRFEAEPESPAAFLIPILFAFLLIVALAGLVRAQTTNANTQRIVIGSTEVESYGIAFEGRTLNLMPTPVVTLTRVGGTADSVPSNVVQSTTVSSTQVTVQLAPNASCTPSGCRKGGVYQLNIQPTDSDGNRPIGTLRVDVQDVKVDPNK